MAPATQRALKRTLAVLKWTALALTGAVLLFALSGWIGSSWARNGDWVEPDPQEEPTIPIMIGSNGVHTEIAMPVVTPEMDWRPLFPTADVIASRRDYTHVAVGWGERKFFLETPSWWNMNPLTVVNAMVGGEGVVHVAHYVRPAPSDDYRVLHLRPAEYRQLVAEITAQLEPVATREVLPGYGKQDVFYTARGTYHLGNTCNQWTSDRLAAAGVEIGAWSPFAGGVMKWVPPVQP